MSLCIFCLIYAESGGESDKKEKKKHNILVMCSLHNSDTLNTRTVSPQIMFSYSVFPPSTSIVVSTKNKEKVKSARTCGFDLWPLVNIDQIKGLKRSGAKVEKES